MTSKSMANFSVQYARLVLALNTVIVVALATPPALASREQPLKEGSYVAALGAYRQSFDDSLLDAGYGGSLMMGLRRSFWAMEIGPQYWIATTEGGDEDAELLGVQINGLLFPFESMPRLYGLLGIGAVEIDKYPTHNGTFGVVNYGLGAGYLFGLQFGDYEFAVRAEARYEYGHREVRVNIERQDLDAPRDWEQAVVGLGLHLPLATKTPPPPPPPPVQVVEPAPLSDADGDGVADPEDRCPDTPPGEQVDSTGCVPAPPPPPPCKTPEPGERISLAGCGTGDIITLRGVNFRYDKSELDANAEALLTGVVEELQRYPDVEIRIVGHTDSRGADTYNQQLSEARAAAVEQYLIDSGIAPTRLQAEGRGEREPMADNETEEGRELNRRVDIEITKGVATSP